MAKRIQKDKFVYEKAKQLGLEHILHESIGEYDVGVEASWKSISIDRSIVGLGKDKTIYDILESSWLYFKVPKEGCCILLQDKSGQEVSVAVAQELLAVLKTILITSVSKNEAFVDALKLSFEALFRSVLRKENTVVLSSEKLTSQASKLFHEKIVEWLKVKLGDQVQLEVIIDESSKPETVSKFKVVTEDCENESKYRALWGIENAETLHKTVLSFVRSLYHFPELASDVERRSYTDRDGNIKLLVVSVESNIESDSDFVDLALQIENILLKELQLPCVKNKRSYSKKTLEEIVA